MCFCLHEVRDRKQVSPRFNIPTSENLTAHVCLVILSCRTLLYPQAEVGPERILSMKFPSKNAGEGLPFPLQGLFPDPGIQPALQADPLPLCHLATHLRRKTYLTKEVLTFLASEEKASILKGKHFLSCYYDSVPSRIIIMIK